MPTRLSGMIALSGLIGAVCGVAGALVAGRTELPTGPVIVLLATAAALASILLAPRRGILARLHRRSALAGTA